MDSSLLECSEQINFEASPEVKASPATGAQMDDAAALLYLVSGGGALWWRLLSAVPVQALRSGGHRRNASHDDASDVVAERGAVQDSRIARAVRAAQ